VRVLLVSRLSLGHHLVGDLPELGSSLGSLLVLGPSSGDGVSDGLSLGQLGDVGGLSGVLSLLGVEPVLSSGEDGEELLLLLGLDEGGVAGVELGSRVVDVLLKGVLSVL
jgi:hypothetical protein